MIALDTSVLVAIAIEEPEGPAFDRCIERQPVVVGAPTLVETNLVLSTKMPTRYRLFMEAISQRPSVTVVAFDERHLRMAMIAHDLYGKGRGHPAQLNLGDCLAYAIAKVHDVPLLFKGLDFSRTDLKVAAFR